MEAPPVKGVVLAVSFLSLFAILITTMPTDFITEGSPPQARVHSYPEYFEELELSDFSATYMLNVSAPTHNEEWGTAQQFGHDMRFYASAPLGYYMYNQHTFPFWFYYLNGMHRMEWINANGISRLLQLDWDEILEDWDNSTAQYSLSCDHFEMRAYVGWNTTLYNVTETGIKSAWDNDNVKVLFGIEMDEVGRAHAMSAWQIIGMLLFFQMPDVHPIINALIAVPVWALIAVLVFQFVMAVIKALPLT